MDRLLHYKGENGPIHQRTEQNHTVNDRSGRKFGQDQVWIVMLMILLQLKKHDQRERNDPLELASDEKQQNVERVILVLGPDLVLLVLLLF